MKNISLEKTLEIIRERGFEVIANPTEKFGKKDTAICIKQEGLSPVYYWEESTPKDSCIDNEEDMAAYIIAYHIKNAVPELKIDPNELFKNKEKVCSSLRIALEPEKEHTDYITRPSIFNGVNEYVYLDLGSDYFARMSQALLVHIEMAEDEVWDIAKKNARKEVTITSMGKIIGIEDVDSMYVISNTENLRGAVSIIFEDVRNELFDVFETDSLTVLPSSVDEVIVCPKVDKEEADEMVRRVNETMIHPAEILANESFIITRAK